MRRLFVRVASNTTGAIEGGVWVRTNGGSPRLRRPFVVSQVDNFSEQAYGGIVFPALSDITIRVTSASANNLVVFGGFDLVVIRQ